MKKLVLGLISFSVLIALIVWLWTLQPQAKRPEESQKTESTGAATQSQTKPTIDPPDGAVLKSASIKIKGKSGSYSYLAIYSNNQSTIIKVSPNSNFEVPYTLLKGLNLITLQGIVDGQKTAEQKTLTYYLDPAQSSTKVFAGSVKTIFDTLITLSAANGDASIRTGKSTQFDIPNEEDEASTSSQIQNVRIGDYAIALGNPPDKSENSDSVVADKVQIIRTNKPKNTKTLSFVKIVSVNKQDIVNVKNTENGKTENYTSAKDSEIILDGKAGKDADIVKDKSAMIISTKDDEENIIDLIYLLP